MLLKKSPKSSVGQSKRFKRRLRFVFDGLQLPDPKGGFVAHIFPLFLFILFIFLVYNLFSIRTVECTFDSRPCSDDITSFLQKFKGQNILLVNQKALGKSLEGSFPVDKTSIGFKMFNKLTIKLLSGNPPVVVNVYLVQTLPEVSMDNDSGSTISADWPRPSQEIAKFSETASASGFTIWDSGSIYPSSSGSSTIRYIFSEKPTEEVIKSIYSLIKITNKYLNIESIQIVGDRIFLSQTGQPDIIVSVPFDEGEITEAFKTFSYLTTIKKDAKVIDLRFKNPIIR